MSSPYHTKPSLSVFAAAELRKEALRRLDKSSLASCARVCITWSRDSLDLIWEELDSVLPLLSILCPLVQNDEDEWCFGRALRLCDWVRFRLYADRTRSLTINRGEYLSSDLKNEIYRKAMMSMTTCLTPKLTKLTVDWSGLAVFSQVFMHSNLKNIILELPPSKVDFEELVDNLTSKSANLEKACFHISENTMNTSFFEDGLGYFFRQHRKLQSIWMPFLTTSVIEALPHLDSLTSIERAHYCDQPSIGADFKVDSSMPSLRLTTLNVLSCFQDVIHLLSHLPNLEVLGVAPRWVESSSSLQALIATVLQACPHLKQLVIEGIPDNWEFSSATTEQKLTCAVTTETISGIKVLYKLDCLQILWPYPLSITEDDLAQLLPSFPKLSTFYLNPAHIVLDDNASLALPPSILPKIADWCPSLENLGLYLNCTGITVDTDEVLPTMDLKCLNLGFSRIDKSTPQLAHYLTYFCCENCSFEGGTDDWLSDAVVEQKVIRKYGDNYNKGRWDGERENVERVFRVVKKLKSRIDALIEKERSAVSRMNI